MKRLTLSASAIGLVLSAQVARASILPPNDLHLEDNPTILANLTQEEFNLIVNNIVDQYKPLALAHGGKLETKNLWDNNTVNASANQAGNSWVINMYGGLARRPEVTPDGFAMVVCHELGHHLGGFPFVSGWASNEGQSDYFATQACARKIWSAQGDENAKFRETVGAFEKEKCDTAWQVEAEQNLCYRVAAAGQSLGNLLATLNKGKLPDFSTPDAKVVRRMQNSHPPAQCRLDTYLRGALCSVTFDETLIPGKGHPKGHNSTEAEMDANMVSCALGTVVEFAARPACWFKSKLK